jgi:hypothetical protein
MSRLHRGRRGLRKQLHDSLLLHGPTGGSDSHLAARNAA